MSRTKIDKKFGKLGYKVIESSDKFIAYQKLEKVLSNDPYYYYHRIDIVFKTNQKPQVYSYDPGEFFNVFYNAQVSLTYSELKLVIKKIKEMKKRLSKMEEKK